MSTTKTPIKNQKYMVMNDDNGDYYICNSLKETQDKIEEFIENHGDEYVQEYIKIFLFGKEVNFSIETLVKIEGN